MYLSIHSACCSISPDDLPDDWYSLLEAGVTVEGTPCLTSYTLARARVTHCACMLVSPFLTHFGGVLALTTHVTRSAQPHQEPLYSSMLHALLLHLEPASTSSCSRTVGKGVWVGVRPGRWDGEGNKRSIATRLPSRPHSPATRRCTIEPRVIQMYSAGSCY